ncbi:MAG: nucleoside-diphosphate sugar epimerase/dehydratase [Deltaproteobacteria bacterium]|nr:nucleoside-diphosphate sugar epimerase/dehydratase [Deltaproteobacteria bacterium]
MHRQLKNPKFYFMILSDMALFGLAYIIAYLLRFDFSIDQDQIQKIRLTLLWIVPVKAGIFLVFGLYRGMWRYTSVRDFWHLLQACVFSMLLNMAVILYLYRFEGYSRAVFLMDGILTLLLAGGLRLFIRIFFSNGLHWSGIHLLSRGERNRKPVLIIGAGDAGEKILREISENGRLHYHVVGFVDDDPHKQGRSIHGIPVMGDIDHLPYLSLKWNIQEALIAIPSLKGARMRKILDVCKNCGIEYKTLPGMGEIIDGRVSVKKLRDVNYEDLLGRMPVQLDKEGISQYIQGRTVLITGCGGSIGSELCRQVVRFQPQNLILVDAGEENLFKIQMELHHELYFNHYRTVLGPVQDKALIDEVFRKYRPAVVFHAAAYKHVPMLEKNPWEAVFNNIIGSSVVMEAAISHGVERFVLVSTDKAVRPTNVMGASKRITELLLQSYQGNGRKFMAVRFGNVVGSSGSVIPLFRRQIEQGGPVTVTHPEVTRYFMTIPEAAQLIIQAGAMGEGDEIFILEMGTPVKIADMARDLITLSGKEPDKDIQIVYTGLREGEKLYEELITVGEGIVTTKHEKIMVLRPNGGDHRTGNSPSFREKLVANLEVLYDAANRHDARAIKKTLQDIVPEYKPQDSESIL